jgi:hypothetical protein
MASWIRDRSLGLFFLGLFLLSWIAQLVVQWFQFRDEQLAHNAAPSFWSSEFWASFGQATLENWQSEFLQLGAFVIAGAYFVYKGSSESPDSAERIEAKIDELLAERGIVPAEVERRLPTKYQRTR